MNYNKGMTCSAPYCIEAEETSEEDTVASAVYCLWGLHDSLFFFQQLALVDVKLMVQ